MAIGSRILESLTVVPVPYKTRIAFALDVLQSKKNVQKPNEPRLRLGVQGVKNIASMNLFSDFYNGARIVQLEDILGNQSHCITIVGRWIFDSNFERALPLCIESFHMCCTDPEDNTGHKVWFKKIVRIVLVNKLQKNTCVYNDLL